MQNAMNEGLQMLLTRLVPSQKGLLRGSLVMFGCFFAILMSVLVQHPQMFTRRHAWRHRLVGLLYLLCLGVGFFDLFAQKELSKFVFHVVLGITGTVLTLTAAYDFKFHEKVRNHASGTLEKETKVSFDEMIEHSFYQGLNLAQIVFLHLVGGVNEGGEITFVERGVLLCFATAPWLIRSRFPVNSFSKNYANIPLQEYSTELLLYRIKKWQYVFWKHCLFHGLNISLALRPRRITEEPLFNLYWMALNSSYVMEFFLQTLVKKHFMNQGTLLLLQKLLMAVSSVCAIFTLSYVQLSVCIASHFLNLYNRGHDFENVFLIFTAASLFQSLEY